MPDVLLSFDRASWLLVKSVTSSQPLPFVTVRHQTTFSDFKRIEGCLLPMRKTWDDGDTKAETTILERRHLAEIDESRFRKPAR